MLSKTFRLSAYTWSFWLVIYILFLALFYQGESIDCEEQGECFVPSCGTIESDQGIPLKVPRAECEEAKGYREREFAKQKECNEGYQKVYDPQQNLLEETLCTVTIEFLLELIDFANPKAKFTWILKGSKKYRKLESVIESLLDGADEFIQKKLNKNWRKIYRKAKKEVKMIVEFYDEIQDATLNGDEEGEYTIRLKRYCESIYPSKNIGNLEANVGYVCETLIDKTRELIIKLNIAGYNEIWKVWVDKGEEKLKALKQLQKDLKKESIETLVEMYPRLENEILLLSQFAEDFTNFKKAIKDEWLPVCERDLNEALNQILYLCQDICDTNTFDEISENWDIWDKCRKTRCLGVCDELDEPAQCICEKYECKKWCPDPEEPFAGECVEPGTQCLGTCEGEKVWCPEPDNPNFPGVCAEKGSECPCPEKQCSYCDIFHRCWVWCCSEGARCLVNSKTCG